MLLVFNITSHMRKTWPQKILRCKDGKKVTNEALSEVAELVLENNIFQFNENTLEQSKGTTIGTKFVPPRPITSSISQCQKYIGGTSNFGSTR